MESQVIGKDRSRLSGRGTVGEVRRGRKWEEAPATEQRREYAGLDVKEEEAACHASASAMTDEARGEERCKPDELHRFCERQQKLYVFH